VEPPPPPPPQAARARRQIEDNRREAAFGVATTLPVLCLRVMESPNPPQHDGNHKKVIWFREPRLHFHIVNFEVCGEMPPYRKIRYWYIPA